MKLTQNLGSLFWMGMTLARKLAILRQSKQDAELAPIGARDNLFICRSLIKSE